jgi:hypothetical protein
MFFRLKSMKCKIGKLMFFPLKSSASLVLYVISFKKFRTAKFRVFSMMNMLMNCN